jgi:hypothetical protein
VLVNRGYRVTRLIMSNSPSDPVEGEKITPTPG